MKTLTHEMLCTLYYLQWAVANAQHIALLNVYPIDEQIHYS